MSNTPEQDPIGHAAKFLWLFSLIPVIFGSMTFFLPKDITGHQPLMQRVFPFILAALISLVGVGVWRRSVAAAWAGIGLFGVGVVGIAIAALFGDPNKKAVLIWAALLIWPIRKLYDAIGAIQAEKARPPAA
ncbi:MAG: hypothetical protein U0441_26790 [Polyangiaceae bacterium]